MSQNAIFKSYADYYDLLYQDKNYEGEVEHVASHIRTFGKNVHTLLDAGCGTGNHSYFFARKGYAVTGVDASEKMIEIARRKNTGAEFFLADLEKLSLGKTFGAAVCLFHVANYFLREESVRRLMRSIYAHLERGGVFVLDSWNADAVLADPPKEVVKRCENESFRLVRTARPVHEPDKHLVTVHYTLRVEDKAIERPTLLEESHTVRYFFIDEIKKFLSYSGFEFLECHEWMTGGMPRKNSFSICFVARKK